MAFNQEVIPALPSAVGYFALPGSDAAIPNPYQPQLPPLPIESADQSSAAAIAVSEHGSPVPQEIFTDPESIAAWRQRLANLDEVQRNLLLKHSQGEVRELTAFVEKACAAYRKQSYATKINNFLRPVCRTAGLYMPAVSVASNADPYPSSLVVGGVVGLLQISNNFNLYQEEIADWLSKFGQRAEILMDYDLCVYQCDPKVQRALADIFGDFLDFCQKVLKIYYKKTGEKRNGTKILAKSLIKKFEDDFGAIIKNFENHLEIYTEAALRSNTRDIQRSLVSLRELTRATGELTRVTERNRQELWATQQWQTQIQEQHYSRLHLANRALVDGQRQNELFQGESRERQLLKDIQKQEEETRQARKLILDWLRPEDFARVKDERRQSLLGDSGRWIFKHDRYKTWKDSSVSDLLWVTGKPGTGKSVLSTIVSDELSTESKILSSVAVVDFLCSSTVLRRSDYRVLLTHLLSQLVFQCPILPTEIESLFKKDGTRSLESSVKDLEETLTQTIPCFDAVYLVIDGLDEFEATKRPLLLQLITSLLSNTKSLLRTVIFSRDYVKELSSLGKYSSIQVEEANKQDISTYICEKIEGLNPDWEDGMVDTVITKLSKSADGMYLYVQLMINTLAEDLTTSEIMQKLSRLPEGLDNAYEANLERVMKQAVSREEKMLICRILLWLANARRPLSPVELLEALSITIGASSIKESDRRRTDRSFTQRCGELIKLQNDGNYHLAHDSLRDYLRDYLQNMGDAVPQDLKMYCDLQSQAGDTIGNTCLTYLLLLPCDSGHFDTREQRDVFQNSYPFFNYAARFWGDHLAASSETKQELVWKFLDSENNFSLAVQTMLDDGMKWTVPQSFTTLHMFAYFGLRDLAKHIPNLRQMRAASDSSGYTPLDYALSEHKKDISMWLMESEKELLCEQLSQQYIALHMAVLMRAIDLLELCIAKSCNINKQAGEYDRTALMVAAAIGYEEATQILLKHGAYADLVDSGGQNALMLALASENCNIATILLPHTELLDVQDSNGLTALHLAARIGATDIVKKLLKHGCRLLPANDRIDGYTPLHEATQKDRLEVVKELFRYDPNLQMTYNSGHQLMHLAAFGNSLKVAKLLVENCVERNPTAPGGMTALHIAAKHGNNDFIELLCEDRNILDILDQETAQRAQTPLQFAAAHGHESTCRLLLDKGAQLDLFTTKYDTPLYISLNCGHMNVARMLLDLGADPMIPSLGIKNYGLHYAAFHGQKELIRTLLDKGSIPEATNKDNESAVHFAASEGHFEFLKELFDAVAEPLRSGPLMVGPDDNNNTPIHKVQGTARVSEQVQLNIIKLLEQHGCNPCIKDSFENLAIHLSVWHGRHTIFEHLFQKDVLNIQGYFNRTLLGISVLQGHEGLMRRLLELGADTEIADEEGSTPLMLAVEGNKENMISELLNHHANLDTSDNLKRNLLHHASSNGNLGLVKRLIELRCDVHARSLYGSSPFMCAVQSDNLDLVEYYLMEATVDVNDSDLDGFRPIHGAAVNGNLAMFTRLLKAGADADARDSSGLNAIYYAASNGRHWLVRPLTHFGISVDSEGSLLTSPLTSACGYREIRCVEKLLENGANVNHCLTYSGQSALHCAASANGPKIIRCLLERNGDIFRKDILGLSPLDYARQYRPCFEAMGKSSSEIAGTLPKAAMGSAWNALCATQAALAALATKDDVDAEWQRLCHTNNAFDALALSRNDSFQRQLKHLKMRLRMPDRTGSPYSSPPDCYFCWYSVDEDSFLVCFQCPDRSVCLKCYEKLERNSEGLQTPPKAVVTMISLENSVRAFRSAMIKKMPPFFKFEILGLLLQLNMITEFIHKKHNEYKEWDDVHGYGTVASKRRPGQEFINLLYKLKEVPERGMGLDDLRECWVKNVKQYSDFQEMCDINIDEPDDLSWCGHDLFKISKEDVEKVSKDRAIFDEDGSLTAGWWAELFEACSVAGLKPQTGQRSPDLKDSKRDGNTAPSESIYKETAMSFPKLKDANSSEAVVRIDKRTLKSSKISNFDRHNIQSQERKIDEKLFGEPSANNFIESLHSFGSVTPSSQITQYTGAPEESLPVIQSNIVEVRTTKSSLTQEFSLNDLAQMEQLDYLDILPLQASRKYSLRRRSSAPNSIRYKGPTYVWSAKVPYTFFDMDVLQQGKATDDRTPNDDTQDDESLDDSQDDDSPDDLQGDDSLDDTQDDDSLDDAQNGDSLNDTQDDDNLDHRATALANDFICEAPAKSDTGGSSRDADEINDTSDKKKLHDHNIVSTIAHNLLTDESKQAGSQNLNNDKNHVVDEEDFFIPEIQEASQRKVFATLTPLNRIGHATLDILEVEDTIEHGTTWDFMVERVLKGNAEAFGLKLHTRILDAGEYTRYSMMTRSELFETLKIKEL